MDQSYCDRTLGTVVIGGGQRSLAQRDERTLSEYSSTANPNIFLSPFPTAKAWEEIRVREESEGGAEIESKIQLPFQAGAG